MLIIEQLLAPNAHSHSMDSSPIPLSKARIPDSMASVEFDAELGDMHHDTIPLEHRRVSSSPTLDAGTDNERAFPLLLGLVIHGSADGLALGVANLSNTLTGTPNAISVVVFLALILHKGMHHSATLPVIMPKYFPHSLAPTALAFTTSLLASSLPRPNCKQYLAIFSASTPLVSIASYMLFSLFGGVDKGNLIGMALLISVRLRGKILMSMF